MKVDYQEFLKAKQKMIVDSGKEVDDTEINPHLFDYQHDIVKWALKKGKSAVFAGTGLGKTRIQLAWADLVGGRVLIFAPLAVACQTVQEGKEIGIEVNLCKENADVKDGINITNYDRMERFDLSRFDGIVLDESSILKSQTGKTRNWLIENCSDIPYKLCCTATPAPNDYMELGNHSEFLGCMTEMEMLAMFFIHDGGDTAKWRLKKHAVKVFWEWVASWAVMMVNPADLGYDGSQFILPKLNITQQEVKTEVTTGSLFAVEAKTLQERQQARRDSLKERVAACAEIVNNSDEQFLVWCNLNVESELIAKSIPDSVEVCGSDTPEHKTESMIGFSEKRIRVLVSKPSICGFGMNWQQCHNMIFVGLSDSFEQYYQAVRRCWRFGQKSEVNVYVITADTEGAVVANIQRKERDFEDMLHGMIAATQNITAQNIKRTGRNQKTYNPIVKMELPDWLEVGA
jgi:superfamily II DNA or RNA helicase